MTTTPDKPIRIRPAGAGDSPVILRFIEELADYEQSRHHVTATVESIATSMFGADSHATPLIAEVDGEAAGFAVYFFNYSTWQGKKGLYLEDLYVTPAHRHAGVGKRLLQHLAQIAVDNDCGRFEWVVLDWNQPAIDFYLSIGAAPKPEWIRYRMEGSRLREFARAHG